MNDSLKDNVSRQEVEEIKKKIISGDIKVPNNKADFEAKYGDVYELDN